MKTRRAMFALMTLMMTTLACVLPGTDTGSITLPTPDTRLENMVAETVSAALEMTANAIPEATATPVIPTEMPASPTPTVSSDIPGSTLTIEPDGTTLFVDENAGYQIRFPIGWLAVRVNEQEFYDAWSLPEAADPHIQTALQSIRNLDPSVFRVTALDTQEGHIINEIVSNVNMVWEQGAPLSFESDSDLQTIADSLPGLVTEPVVISTEIVVPPNGAPFGLIKTEVGGVNALSAPVTIYQQFAYFNLNVGTLTIAFTTESGFIETTEPDFVSMLNSLSIITE